MKTLFDIPPIEPPPKVRKKRKKSNRYFVKENRRRYRLHRKVKDLSNVQLEVRARILILPVGFNIDFYPSVKELILRFKYFAPTLYTPHTHIEI